MARTKVSKKAADTWYLQPDYDLYKTAHAWTMQARAACKPWYDQVIYCMSLYAGTENITGTGLQYASSGQDKLRWNVISSATDTALSIVGSARTLPYFLPRGGDWSTQRRAKRCTATIQSQFQNLKLFDLGTRVIQDGIVCSLGALAFFVDPETGKPGVERMLPLEGAFDPTEALTGDPRTFVRSKPLNRDVAIALWPKYASELAVSKGPSYTDRRDFAFQRDSQADQIVVHEIWKLPSKKGAKDGKHAIFVDNCTLFAEKWERPRFPIAFYRWSPRQLGFLGKSLVEEAEPCQRRIEHIIRYSETCQDLMSKPQIWIEAGAKVEAEQIDNQPASVNRYSGPQPPTLFTFDATPHDMEASIDAHYTRLLTQLGLSQSQISGEKPAGVTSAVGLKTVEEVSSRRHVTNIRSVEKFYLECSQCLYDMNDEIAASDKGYAIDRKVRSRFLESTKWSEVKKQDDDFEMAVYPTSSLPPSPAGQLDTIQDWINQQYVPPDVGMMLLGLPDTQAYTDEATADRVYIEWQIEKLSDGKRVVPDPYCNLELAADLVRRHYLSAKADGATEEVLNQFRWFLSSVKTQLTKVKVAAQPPAPPVVPPSGGVVPMAPAAQQMMPLGG
jgi:hypothetical protein